MPKKDKPLTTSQSKSQVKVQTQGSGGVPAYHLNQTSP